MSDPLMEMIDALADYVEARQARDKLAGEANSQEWHYFGERVEGDLERAAERCRQAFKRYDEEARV